MTIFDEEAIEAAAWTNIKISYPEKGWKTLGQVPAEIKAPAVLQARILLAAAEENLRARGMIVDAVGRTTFNDLGHGPHFTASTSWMERKDIDYCCVTIIKHKEPTA